MIDGTVFREAHCPRDFRLEAVRRKAITIFVRRLRRLRSNSGVAAGRNRRRSSPSYELIR